MRPVLALVALVTLALFPTASPASARCVPVAGYRLVRVGDGPMAAGGTMLVALAEVYRRSEAIIDLPLTSVSLRAGHRTETVTARSLAANLFAITLPARAGHYTSTDGLTVDVDVDASAAAATPSSAPTLATPPMGRTPIGTRVWAPTIELAAAAPTEAVGVVLSWDDGTWFVASGEERIGPGRCTPDVPGFDPIDAGDRVSARFVGAGGGLSPEASFTAVVPE